MGQIQSFEEFVNLLVRRRILIAVVAILITLISAYYAKTRTDTFEAAAAIQIEAPAVTTDDPTGQQPATASQVLQMIEQRLTARDNLAAMIERHGLYVRLGGLTLDKKITLLRSSISFQSIESAAGQNFGQPRGISAILVFARMDDPDLAARVANDLAQGILDQSAEDQRSRAGLTVAFFDEEVSRLGGEIDSLEAMIAAYKNENAAALPDFRDARRDEMVSLDSNLRELQQAKLALSSQADQINAKSSLRETDRRALDDIAAQTSVLDAQIASSLTRKGEIEAALLTAPEVERVLAGYERTLGQLQAQYDAATARKAQAVTDVRLAERQQAERFTLLDRAVVPEAPIGGGKKKIAIAGAFAGIVLAIGLAFVMDLLFPVLRSAAQMERQLDLRPVVTIPEVKRPRVAAKGRGVLKMLDDPTKPLFGMPRFAVIAAGVSMVLLAAASIV